MQNPMYDPIKNPGHDPAMNDPLPDEPEYIEEVNEEARD